MSETKRGKLGDANLLMTVAEYIKNKAIKFNTVFRIKADGSCCYVLDGEEITCQELNKKFPELKTSYNTCMAFRKIFPLLLMFLSILKRRKRKYSALNKNDAKPPIFHHLEMPENIQ